MVRLDAFPAAPSWFVMVPDCDAARTVWARLDTHASQRIDHTSGRPWLLGNWPHGTVVTVEEGTAKVAVLGQHATVADDLRRRVEGAPSVDVLDRVVDSVVGSVHLAASVDGVTGIQGSATGVRRVYVARVGNVACAADRADVLAHLCDAPVEPHRLALHLLEPPILYPIAGRPVWRDVSAVQPGDRLVLNADGHGDERTWWTPPRADQPLRDGARALCSALTAGIAARVRGQDLATCDLGGVDSTAVCCVAADTARTVVAYTAASPDPLADDVTWAQRTVAARGDLEHHVIGADEMPLVYHGLGRHVAPLDEPSSVTVDRDRWLTIARRARDRGSRLHLVGFGGDELLYGSVAHVADALRTHPRTATRHLRGFTAKYRWPRRRVLRQVADRRPYRAWLRDVADAITTPAPPADEPLLAWGFEPRLPPWATLRAADAVREQIQHAADGLPPSAPTRGQHRELEAMRFVSRIARQFEQLAAADALTLAAPYYDDAVVAAGLSVRPLERVTPWRYKPLLAEAMRGIVPDDARQRATKANGTVDEEPGLRRHRADVLELWDDARLGELGLVDVDLLRRVCAGPLPPGLPSGVLYQTIACEVWLRSLDRTHVTT
ncbi:MAG TPA: asparagine synthase-related protein [Euzebyales bacterium]|nr:asparagine synthase-related protein [Euzebyales bacterium]